MSTSPLPRQAPSGFWRAAWALVRDGERAMYAKAPAMIVIVMLWGVALTGDVTDGYLSTRQLHDHGRAVTATRVQLYISADACRTLRCATDARVQVPGHRGWVALRDLAQYQAIPDDQPTGWQPATPQTGYAAPLPVLVWDMPGGRVDAMAQADVEDARNPGRLVELAGGVGILLAVLVTLVVWARRLRADPPPWLRRTLRPQRSQA